MHSFLWKTHARRKDPMAAYEEDHDTSKRTSLW